VKNPKLFILAFACIALGACNTHEEELAKANRQKDSLESVINERDTSISNFLSSYTEIQTNLDSIAHRGNVLSGDISNKTELKANAKEKIIADINTINALLMENKQKIDDLNKKLKGSSYKNKQLEKMITALNEQIAMKDQELAGLNDQLVALSADMIKLKTTLDTLNFVNSGQADMITKQTTALHTAYYAVGRSKDLEAKKVIDKTGGLLGIGKTAVLGSTNNSNFTQIDYAQVSRIDINIK
jgi:chromosome segregation ATPase